MKSIRTQQQRKYAILAAIAVALFLSFFLIRSISRAIEAHGRYPAISTSARRSPGVNPVTLTRYDEDSCNFQDTKLHHPNILQFNCWSGEVPEGGHVMSPFGTILPSTIVNGGKLTPPSVRASAFPAPSVYGEEYIQYIAAASSVLDAKRSYVAVELGAAYGRWLLNAFHLNMQKKALPTLLVGVEGDLLRQNQFRAAMAYNTLRDFEVMLFPAVIANEDGTVYFCGGGNSGWYGQSITSDPSQCSTGLGDGSVGTVTSVRALSIKSILHPLDRVDYMDMDVQYAELGAVKSSKEEIDKKVKHLIIEVHDLDQMDEFVQIFTEMGWEVQYALRGDSGYNSEATTKHGPLLISAGMFYAKNPKI